MTKVNDFLSFLTGDYEILNTGSFKNTKTGLRLYIGKCSKPNKPSEILLYLNPVTGKREWISGLFSVSDGYCFDRGGRQYLFQINDSTGTAKIQPCIECRGVIHSWYVKRGKSHK